MATAQGGLAFLFGGGAAPPPSFQLLFYLTGSIAPGSGHAALQVAGGVPLLSTGATRWVVGTLAPTQYARMKFSNKSPSTADFGGIAQPSSGPVVTSSPTLGDSYRSGRYRGNVDAATWYFYQPVQASPGNGGTQDGRIRLRIWKGSDPTGANATELTSGAQVGTTVTNLASLAPQVSGVTVALPSFALNAEYLFFQVAWEITGAGSSSTADVSMVSNYDAMILGPALPAEIPGFYAYFLPGTNSLAPLIMDTSIDLTNRLMAYQSKRGRDDPLSGITAGQLSVDLDDDDNALDSENPASPLYPQIKLRQGLTVVASYRGFTYYRGRVSINTLTAEPLVLGADVSIAGQDYYQQLLSQTITGSYTAEPDWQRIETILESLGYLSVLSSDGTFQPPAATLVNEPVLQHFDLIVKAGRGTFFISANGIPVYRDRHWRLTQTSIGTFGAQGEYPIPTPRPVLDDAGLYNQVKVLTPGSLDEIQQIIVSALANTGTFTLTVYGQTTTALAYNTTAAQVQAALEALSTIGSGNVSCSGGPFPSSAISIHFTGQLAHTDIPTLTASSNINGGFYPVVVSTVQNGADTTLTSDDATSQTDYGVIPYTVGEDVSGLLASSEDAQQWADWFVYQHAVPTARFRVIELDPYANPALWPLVFAADIGTKLTIMHDLPGTKGLVAEDYYIEGIEETVVLQGEPDLRVRWSVSRAEPDTFWILDDFTALEIDTRLAY